MLSIFQEIRAIFQEIRAMFAEPDPKRFAYLSVYPTNWNGENDGKSERKGGAVLTNKETQTFEFGRTDILIDENLTVLDIKELQKRNLDPTNPSYAKCKAYFSKMPYCNKKELAANSIGDESKGEYFEGIMPETAAKVLAAFRAFLVQKPTF